MTKAHTTLSVNVEKLQKAKRLGINCSQLFEKSIEAAIHSKEADIDSIDYEKLLIEIGQLREELIVKEQQKASIDKKMEEKRISELEIEKKRLESEKKRLEEIKSCWKCGRNLDQTVRNVKTPKGDMCKSCMLNLTGEEYKSLFTTQNSDVCIR